MRILGTASQNDEDESMNTWHVSPVLHDANRLRRQGRRSVPVYQATPSLAAHRGLLPG